MLDADTGEPISHARVTAIVRTAMFQAYGDVLAVLTGEDGHFSFSGLPKSEGEIHAEKAGYVVDIRNNRFSAGPDILNPPFTFRLKPLGDLIVRVVDDSGSPVVGAQIDIERQVAEPTYGFSGGSYSSLKDGTRVSLFRGSYRIGVISPGAGELLRARDQTFLPTYYPGTPSVTEARWVDVVPGKQITVELPIKPIPARRVHGRLNVDGHITQISVLSADSKFDAIVRGLPQWSFDSSEFWIYGLPPGIYPIEVGVCFGRPCMQVAGFRKTIQVVDSDIDDLVISDADRLPDR